MGIVIASFENLHYLPTLKIPKRFIPTNTEDCSFVRFLICSGLEAQVTEITNDNGSPSYNSIYGNKRNSERFVVKSTEKDMLIIQIAPYSYPPVISPNLENYLDWLRIF
jgi:hypothetical protein